MPLSLSLVPPVPENATKSPLVDDVGPDRLALSVTSDVRAPPPVRPVPAMMLRDTSTTFALGMPLSVRVVPPVPEKAHKSVFTELVGPTTRRELFVNASPKEKPFGNRI
jgi:hypothetical protein